LQLAISGTELEENESIAPLIESARELEISFLELWYPRNTGASGLERTLEAIEEAGLRVACVSTGSELYRRGGSLEDQSLLIEAIELAARVGARFVNTYFGYHAVRDDEAAIAAYRSLLQPCLVRAEKHGVTIVLENEFNAFGVDTAASDITRRPSSLRRLFEEVDSPLFRANFDACNFYCAGVEPYPHAYELLRPYIAYCHVKDGALYQSATDGGAAEGWRRFTDYDNEYVMRPLGEGAIPWANLLRSLSASDYDGFLTLEPHSAAELRAGAWRQAAHYVRENW
jgi:sugar phosphate isomerase/epimerase